MDKKQSTEVEFANEEVNLKEVFRKVMSHLWEFLRFWWLIAGLSLFFGYVSYRSTSKVPKTYKAEATFMIADKKEEIVYNYSASVDYGIGEATTVQYNLDKVIQLAMSMRVVYDALLSKTVINGKEDFLINHVMDEYELNKKWGANNPEMASMRITHDTLAQFDRLEMTLMKNVYFLITGLGGEGKLCNGLYDQDSGFIHISATTTCEGLSIALVNAIFESLSKFYIYTESEKQRKVYNLVMIEADSIRGELVTAQRRLLEYKDRMMGLSREQYDAKKILLEEEVHKLTIIFAEAIKDRESTEMALRNTIPFIIPIDMPCIPIRPNQPSPPKAFVSSAVVTSILTMVFLVLRRIVLNIWNKDQPQAPPKPTNWKFKIDRKTIQRYIRIYVYMFKRKIYKYLRIKIK